MIDGLGSEVEPEVRTDLGRSDEPTNPDEELDKIGDQHRFYCTGECEGSALVGIDRDRFARTGDEECPECGGDTLYEPAHGRPLVAYRRGGGE